MTRKVIATFLTIMSLFSVQPLFSDSDNVRIRTFVGMEPYGRMSVKNWDSAGHVEKWNVAYGVTPGVEVLAVVGRIVEIGGGARFQIPRRELRSGNSGDEKFSYIPVYAIGHFDIVDSVGIDMYGTIRLGYSFLLGNQAFKDAWQDEAGLQSLDSTGGGFYAGASLGVIFVLADRENWGLDWSMDAGYSFHGGSGSNGTKNFAINYQAMSVDFALDWRF